MVTALLILGSVRLLIATRPPNAVAAFLSGLALMAGVRSFTGVYYLLAVRPRYPGARPFFDEMNVARALDVSVDWIAWPTRAWWCWRGFSSFRAWERSMAEASGCGRRTDCRHLDVG